MANDFGSNFLRGFQPNFANNFDTSFRYGLNQKEQERQRKEQEKAQQEQMGILNQLVSGKLNQQDQTNLVGRADDNTLQRYGILSKMNAPQERKPLTNINYSGKEIKAFDPNDNKIVSLGENPDYEEQKPEKVWIKDERFGDKMKKLMGYENPDADENDPQTRNVSGKKYTVTDYTVNDIWEKKTDGNGQPRVSLKDEIKKSLGDYYKKQQEYLAITNAGFGNKQVDGKENEVTYKEKLNTHNKIYSEAVKNTMSETARGWYDRVYNYQDENKQTGDPDPQDYWALLREDYVKGKLGKDPNKEDDYEDADFQILTENFKAIYGFDPTQVYGY